MTNSTSHAGGRREGSGRKPVPCRMVTLRLPPQTYAALKELADQAGMTSSALFRKVLVDYITLSMQ